MKKLFYILLSAVVLSLSMTGCDDWLDINTSPDNPVTVTHDVLYPAVLFFTIQQVFDNTEYHNYLTQCLTGTGRSPMADYAYRAGWGGFPDMNRHPHWRRHYYEIGVNCDEMIKSAEEQKAYNYWLIARTIKLHSLMITTDEYGEMPYDQAYKSNTPKYDSQEHIYCALEQEFRDVIDLYNDPAWVEAKTNPMITQKIDRMYSGDLKKYRALTYALFARFWVHHIPNWGHPNYNDPAFPRANYECTMAQCCDSVIKYVNLALADWTEPRYQFDGGTAEKNCQWGPNFRSGATMNLGWPQGRENNLGNCVPTKFLASIMGFYKEKTGLKKTTGVSSMYALDPRAVRMFQPTRGYILDEDFIALRSLKSNIGCDIIYGKDWKMENLPDLYCNTADSTKAEKESFRANPLTLDAGYITIITEEELLFGLAEAYYWKGDKPTAYSYMKQAVDKSFARFDAEKTYASLAPKNQETCKQMFEDMRLKYDNFDIAMLMQQKFVALYLNPEQYTDMRRYNFSSSNNGITYDNTYVYDVKRVPIEKRSQQIDAKDPGKFFSLEYALERPYNLYQPHFLVEGKDFITGGNFPLSCNAWINRLTPDPETEDKYNRAELEKMNAYRNPDYLRARMVWQRDFGCGAITGKGDGDWNQFNVKLN